MGGWPEFFAWIHLTYHLLHSLPFLPSTRGVILSEAEVAIVPQQQCVTRPHISNVDFGQLVGSLFDLRVVRFVKQEASGPAATPTNRRVSLLAALKQRVGVKEGFGESGGHLQREKVALFVGRVLQRFRVEKHVSRYNGASISDQDIIQIVRNYLYNKKHDKKLTTRVFDKRFWKIANHLKNKSFYEHKIQQIWRWFADGLKLAFDRGRDSHTICFCNLAGEKELKN